MLSWSGVYPRSAKFLHASGAGCFAGDRRTVSPLDIGGGEIRGLRPSYFASTVGPASRPVEAQRGDLRGVPQTRAGFDAERGIIPTPVANPKAEVERSAIEALRPRRLH